MSDVCRPHEKTLHGECPVCLTQREKEIIRAERDRYKAALEVLDNLMLSRLSDDEQFKLYYKTVGMALHS